MKAGLFTICLLIFSFNAKAGILVEPSVGYNTGAMSYDLSDVPAPFNAANGNYKLTNKGMDFGLRLGYSMGPFAIAADYLAGTLSQKEDSVPSSLFPIEATDLATTALGLTFKFTGLPMFDLWATYIFDFKAKDVDDPDNDGKDTTVGNGTGIGVGFTGLPFISINLEYRMITFNEIQSSDGNNKLPYSDPLFTLSKIKGNLIRLSVSAPFDLL